MVLLQGLVIGRVLIDTIRQRSVQHSNDAAAAFRAWKQSAKLVRSHRRCAGPAFSTVYNEQERASRLGGFVTRRLHTSPMNKLAHERDTTTTGGYEHLGDDDFEGVKWTEIYRFTRVHELSVVSRFKLYQTILTLVLSPYFYKMYLDGTLEYANMLAAQWTLMSATFALYAMSALSTGIVGVINISDDREWIRVATLTFWGRRKNMYIPIEDVMPLSETITEREQKAINVVCLLKRYSSDKPRLTMPAVSTHVSDHDLFQFVFGDSPLSEQVMRGMSPFDKNKKQESPTKSNVTDSDGADDSRETSKTQR